MENRKRFGIKPSHGKPRHYTPPRQNTDDFVFGIQSVLELLRSEKEIEKILVNRELSHAELETLAKEKGAIIQRVPLEKLNKVTMKNHQGVVAFISAVSYSKLSNVIADAYEKGKVPLVLIIDRVTDVRNFGAMARTAEASGVDAIVVPTRGAALITSDAMKTSSGALSFIPVCRENDLTLVLEELQASGFIVMGCTEKASDSYYQQDFSGPVAIVMGSEEDGISDSLLRKCDYLGQIPMLGKVGSLNVSVACGIMLYEVIRQRQLAG